MNYVGKNEQPNRCKKRRQKWGEWSGDSGVARGACPLPAPLPLFMFITGVGLPVPDLLWCRTAGAVAGAVTVGDEGDEESGLKINPCNLNKINTNILLYIKHLKRLFTRGNNSINCINYMTTSSHL